MGWLDRTVNENKGIEMIGGSGRNIVNIRYEGRPLGIKGDRSLFYIPCPSHIDRETGLPKKELAKVWKKIMVETEKYRNSPNIQLI